MLKERFPGKQELTLDDYAEYFQISRVYASKHLLRNNHGRFKIAHKRMGRRIIIPIIDFAYWLAQCKISDGRPIVMPTAEELRLDMKQRHGFNPKPKYNYRRLG